MPPPITADSASHAHRLVRILILEDDPAILASLISVLQSSGFEALTPASLLTDALQHLEAGEFDIALVDLNLPDGFGFTLIEALARHTPRIPSLVLTSMIDQTAVVDAIQAGASGYIIKDDSAIQINHALLEVLAGHQILSAAATALLMQYVGALAPLHSPTALKQLTEREAEILDLIAQGLTYQQIGEVLTIATSTVQTHIKSIYAKLKVRNKAQAIRTAFGPGQHST